MVDFDEKRELTTGRKGGYSIYPRDKTVGTDFQEKRVRLILGQGVDSPEKRAEFLKLFWYMAAISQAK